MAVFELRVALTVKDFDAALRFYKEGLGLDPGELWTDGGMGQMLSAGRGTLEIFDDSYATHVDQLEVGRRVSEGVRLAFEVPDVEKAVENAIAYGATLVAAPTRTPWGDLNARVTSPDGLQVTLYQVSGD